MLYCYHIPTPSKGSPMEVPTLVIRDLQVSISVKHLSCGHQICMYNVYMFRYENSLLLLGHSQADLVWSDAACILEQCPIPRRSRPFAFPRAYTNINQACIQLKGPWTFERQPLLSWWHVGRACAIDRFARISCAWLMTSRSVLSLRLDQCCPSSATLEWTFNYCTTIRQSNNQQLDQPRWRSKINPQTLHGTGIDTWLGPYKTVPMDGPKYRLLIDDPPGRRGCSSVRASK